MEDKNSLLRWEKYSPWLKFDRIMSGPILIMSLLYLLAYTVFILVISVELVDLKLEPSVYYKLHLVTGGLFIAASILAFSGWSIRRAK